MELLKAVLGSQYDVVKTAIDTHNANPENKNKQIKLANLATGKYVSKNKYLSLESKKKKLESQIKRLNSTIDISKQEKDKQQHNFTGVKDIAIQIHL